MVKLDAQWYQALKAEFSKPYMQELKTFLQHEQASGKIIYPQNANIFRAFELTPLDKVKVVILGQDPYHRPGQAHGLCQAGPRMHPFLFPCCSRNYLLRE